MASIVEGATSEGLRTQCLLGASTVAAFVTKRFLGPVREHPWRFAAGDISANIDAMLLDDSVAELGCPGGSVGGSLVDHMVRQWKFDVVK